MTMSRYNFLNSEVLRRWRRTPKVTKIYVKQKMCLLRSIQRQAGTSSIQPSLLRWYLHVVSSVGGRQMTHRARRTFTRRNAVAKIDICQQKRTATDQQNCPILTKFCTFLAFEFQKDW